MSLVDHFLVWWLKRGRYPWSRFVRKISLIGKKELSLPQATSLEDVIKFLSQVTWTMDSILHLYDSISLPEIVWRKKRDDCDGFAILAAALLKNWNPSTNPKLMTVMLSPIEQSHTVCVFRHDGFLRFFDNQYLNPLTYQTYEEIVEQIRKRGKHLICWDVADPDSLRTLEFYTRSKDG